MRARHYIPSGISLIILIADLAKPGYGNFGLNDAIKPPIETATRAIAKVEDYVAVKDGTVALKIDGCKGKPTPGYVGFTATQWEQFKKAAKGKDADKAVTMLGGKLCDVVDGFIALPQFAPNKKLKVTKDKKGKVSNIEIKNI